MNEKNLANTKWLADFSRMQSADWVSNVWTLKQVCIVKKKSYLQPYTSLLFTFSLSLTYFAPTLTKVKTLEVFPLGKFIYTAQK